MEQAIKNKLSVVMEIVKYEFKKIWNKVTVISVISLIVLCSALNVISIAYYSGLTIMKSDGDMIIGVESYKTLKNETKPLEGTLNQKYLDNLTKKYNSSKEKMYLNSEDRNMIPNYTRYTSINYLINFAEYSSEMNSNYFNLDFDFIQTEDKFYEKYKEAVMSKMEKNNKDFGIFEYSDRQLEKISQKVDRLEPFYVGYTEGLNRIIDNYVKQFWFVLIVIAFSLSSIFSKDSNNGIEELGLSSELGRKVNMNARVISGNIFSVVVYVIFWLVLLIEHGAIYSLSGWGVSVQEIWYDAIYNMTYGGAILMIFTSGLLVALLIANFVMMISIRFKYSKISAIISVASVYTILKLTETGDYFMLQINPIYYATRLSASNNVAPFDIYYFMGDIIVPYSLLGLILIVFYFVIIRLLTVRAYRKYRLN